VQIALHDTSDIFADRRGGGSHRLAEPAVVIVSGIEADYVVSAFAEDRPED